ncbi:MAG: diphosphate--fructose-6-phosphate 1-phosphotransferase [Bacteroidales bacterium]|jgi:pyrophosphate--fructose-6-phosphate 1-phosphotransferase|nr:diphosphate--fructose-6-phosphate 1-phosphotransferase [Bacteroidales bacterium]
MDISILQKERAKYQPELPKSIRGAVKLITGHKTESVANQKEIAELFPNTYGMPLVSFEAVKTQQEKAIINVGVILSGGQAPGGHNVISGIFDGIKKINPASRLYGFLGGPGGLVNHKYIELTDEIINKYRNTGGFDIIGSGRTKLEEKWQFDKGLEIAKKLNLNALVIIGGDDSNTNACVLAEYYAAVNAKVQVIGCPKTIDGDMKNEMIETSFGFDTATKVYSELIGNIQRDANSAKKYWHFIKLMGRSASHIGLECALKTHPNITIISEEVAAKNQTLNEIVDYIAGIVVARSNNGENFGVVLIPEGLVEFVPEMKALILELNDLFAEDSETEKEFHLLPQWQRNGWIADHLSASSSDVFRLLPPNIATELTLERDPHGNVQVSLIETEKLLGEMVKKKLTEMKKSGEYTGKFGIQFHFFGYEGRCAAPSNFDADYCYSLGFTAAMLVSEKKTGYMSSIRNLTAPAEEWIACGVPITMMINMEKRHGHMKPVIQKALVDLNGAPFKYFVSKRDEWAKSTQFVYPGPIQYFGPSEICDMITETLKLEKA